MRDIIIVRRDRAALRAMLFSGGAMCLTAACLAATPASAQTTEPAAPIAPEQAATAAPDAQDAAAPGTAIPADEIVVTGTSIRGAAPVGTTVQVLDSAALEQSGLSTTSDVLKTIPQVINLGFEEGRGGGVQGAQGNVTQARTVNLRGLGVESTLVLLNGRRVPPAGTLGAGYDVGIFPNQAIGRLEVVADGASAIYGSDAVGGVINFITKRGRDGTESTFRYGFADGFDEKRFSQTVGLTWKGGDFFWAYEHYERGGLLGSERDLVTQDLRSGGGPDTRGNFGVPGTVVVGTTTYATPTGTNGRGLTAANFIAGTANREDTNLTRSLLVDQNQDQIFGSVHQEITPELEGWVEGFFSDRDYEGFGSSLSRGAAVATLVVPRSNPFFVHPTNPAAASVSVNYSFSQAFPFTAVGGERPWSIAAGLTDRPFGDWVVDGAYNHIRNSAYRRATQIWTFNLAGALADSNPATAFNPFCDPVAVSNCFAQSTLDRLRGYNIIAAKFRQTDWTLKANGSLFHLPGGNVGLAVGGQYFDSDLLSTITTLTTTATPAPRPILTGRTVKAGFAELLVPIFGAENETPFFHRLELSAAVRVDDYSDFGSTTNPKFGATWAPVDGLSLRGSYGTSYRAPTLANIDFRTSATYATSTVFDPVRNQNVRFLSLVGFTEGIGPESANTYTFGVDLAPRGIPGLRAGLTYYNIDYKNRIASISASTILQNPTLYAAFITRDPSAALVLSYMNTPYFTSVPENPANIALIVDGRTANIGGLKQEGLDGNFSYAFGALDSDWNIGATFTKILKAELSPGTGLPFGDVLDLINNPVSFRGRANLGWGYEGARIDAFVNHIGSYDNNLRNPVEKVDSWTTLDLTLSYQVPDSSVEWLRGLRASISLINATDADPPFVINTTASAEGLYDSQNASVIGRFVAFELSKKF